MLKEYKMVAAGASLANMVLVNVLEISLKHVLLKNMTSIPKPYHLSSAYKLIHLIGQDPDKDAQLN